MARTRRGEARGGNAAIGCTVWCFCVALTLAMSPHARADKGAVARKLLVLRDDDAGVDRGLARELDRVLEQTLASASGFEVQFSPTSFSDVELAADCQGRDAACLQRIATTLGSDWLLVRELYGDAHGTTFITLVAQDGPDTFVSRRATASLSRRDPRAPHSVVPVLVSRLYAGSELSNESSPGFDPRSALGWTSIGLGGALLSAGLVVGAFSNRDEEAYAELHIRDAMDVERAESLLAQSERRARFANGLLIGSGGMVALGTALLLWKKFGVPERETSRLQLAAGPLDGGAAFLVSGELDRGRP